MYPNEPTRAPIKPLRVLLIGGSGFLSGTLGRLAVAAGHSVTAVTRGRLPLPAGVSGITIDRHDREAFADRMCDGSESWDLVVDCIGYDPEDARQDIAVFRNNATQFVFISTDFVFEPGSRSFPQTEECAHYKPGGYGGNKRLCELEFINGDTANMRWTILRPGHIYGPGGVLGCLPLHCRDTGLLDTLRAGRRLKLVGGGYFLQQPIYAPDLARTILSCAGNEDAANQVYMAAGPDIIESREYYRIIAKILGMGLEIEELPVGDFAAEHPEMDSFLCHRFCDLSKLRADGLEVPATRIEHGLREQIKSLEASGNAAE